MNALLGWLGIDAKKFRLLMGLFSTISERGEMMDQLGQNGVALRTVSIFYVIFSALLSFGAVVVQMPVKAHLGVFLVFTGFLFTSILLSEAGNSLINPAEGMVLAHQPIPGATYTAAKLSHLVFIVLWLVPALNGIPALAGPFLPGGRWFYPLEHLAAAMALGIVVAMLVCAAYGWLMRFIPAKRLKGIGQFAGAVPFLAMMWMGQLERGFRTVRWSALLPTSDGARWAVEAGAAAAAAMVMALGIRSLSADYLIRVSAMMRGGARGGSSARRSWGAAVTARLGGGQGGRAGFCFVSRLMRRDWQFRRQIFATAAPLLIVIGTSAVQGWKLDPFGREFSPMHLAPHALGVLLAFACSLLPFGNDYKGGWVFSLAAASAMRDFAWGVYGVMAEVTVVVNAVAAPVFVWRWGAAHGALFAVYSLAVGLVYVALAMKAADGIPFTQQPNPQRAALTMPVVIVAVMVIGMAVAVQHYLLFRSAAAVALAVVALAVAGWFGARWSVGSFAEEMELQLAERGIYQEVAS